MARSTQRNGSLLVANDGVKNQGLSHTETQGKQRVKEGYLGLLSLLGLMKLKMGTHDRIEISPGIFL